MKIKKNMDHYPVSMSEIHRLRKALLDYIFALIRNPQTPKKEKEFLILNTHVLANEIMHFYVANILLDHGEEVFVENFTIASSIKKNEAPPFNFLYEVILHRKFTSNFLIQALRKIKSILQKDPIRYQALQDNKKDHVLTVTRSDLIICHKNEAPTDLRRNDLYEWFDPSALPALSENPLDASFLEQLKGDIKAILKGFGISWRPDVEHFLYDRFFKLAHYTLHFLAQARAKKNHLPGALWIVSAGMPLIRILAFVARENGCRVVAHDHGSGFGWLESEYQTLFDFNYVDQFVTFSPLMADALKANINEHYLLNQSFKESKITPIALPKTRTQHPEHGPLTKDQNRILFLANVYMIGYQSIYPGVYYDVQVEWHRRLFAYLMAEGYEVTMRPHPDDHTKRLEGFDDLNIKIDRNASVETTFSDTDIVMVDVLTTTSLIDALKQGKKSVLLDLDHMEDISENALERVHNTMLYRKINFSDNNIPEIPANLAQDIRTFEYYAQPEKSFLAYHNY